MALVLIKRLVLGRPITPAEEDGNKTLIENAVNTQEAQLAVSLNPDGTLKNNSVSTAAIQDRAVTQRKIAFAASPFYATDTGAVNALAITFTPAAAALTAGMVFFVKAAATNTGPSTLTVDALAATAIRKPTEDGLAALEGGEIHVGCVGVFAYDGTFFQLVGTIDVATVPGASLYGIWEEQQPAGTNGGTFTGGSWEQRMLNTEVYDPDGIGAIVANCVRLQPGKYRLRAQATWFRVIQTRLRLWNVTANAVIIGSYSMSGYDDNGDDNGNIVDESVAEITLTVQSDIRVEHRAVGTYASQGFGVAANVDGVAETYCRLEVWKLE